MNQRTHNRNWSTARILALGAVTVALAGVGAQAQQGASLADMARQARAQKQAQTQSQAQPVADVQQDTSNSGAPAGFENYPAGDYSVWVPAPYHADGQDANGAVLSGPLVGNKRSIVVIGNPVAAHFDNDGVSFGDTATQIARRYAPTAQCNQATVANRTAYACPLQTASVQNRTVTGAAVFVQNTGKLYPIFCFSRSEVQPQDPSKRPSPPGASEKVPEDPKAALQSCNTVFQSVRFSQAMPAQNAAAVADAGNSAGSNNPAQPPTVNTPSSTASNSAAPAFKAQPFVYCRSARECWNGSVMVPGNAQLVNSDCKQFVYEMKVGGDSFLLLAGPSNGCDGQKSTSASVVRWKQLVDSENERAPGTSSTISNQQLRLDGKTALITQMRFKNGLADWMAKRAEVDTNGTQVVVGCMAPKGHFADGDAICTALIESLRLP